MSLSVYDEGTVLRYLYFGVEKGVYPPLIFLGIGAMTDFSTMLSNPKLVLLGAAAQVGVFLTYLGALCLAFTPQEAGCDWNHRRCGWTDGDLPRVAVGSGATGSDRDRRVFLHGPGTRHSAADHEAADDETRAIDPHEAVS